MFDRIGGFVEQTGLLDVALLMFVESLFPPVPSELIMPLAGFTAARGELGMLPVILVGTAGSLAGALFWYAIGRWLGPERLKHRAARHGRWLTLAPEEVDEACRWFHRHGGKAVLLGRLVPAVRTLISVPAGIARMPVPRFLLASSVGTALWTTLLALAGYLLEDRYDRVAAWANPVSNLVIGVLLAWYLYRVISFQRAPRRAVLDRRAR